MLKRTPSLFTKRAGTGTGREEARATKRDTQERGLMKENTNSIKRRENPKYRRQHQEREYERRNYYRKEEDTKEEKKTRNERLKWG